MHFAFDYDDTITISPIFFAAVIRSLYDSGHRITILTDFDEHFRSYRESELASNNIPYHDLIITSEKDKYCREKDIDFLIDDDTDYFKTVKPHRLFLGIYKSNSPREA